MKNDGNQGNTHELWKKYLENAILHKVEKFSAISDICDNSHHIDYHTNIIIGSYILINVF